MKQIFNFSAGPAILPQEVLLQVQEELCNWQSSGSSVMEVSHRGKAFMQLAEESEQDLRQLLSIPPNYKVLFSHGGARGQFAAIPLNLTQPTDSVDYINSGYWSLCAAKEAEKYCQPQVIDVCVTENNVRAIRPMNAWLLNNNSSFVHFCPNETIDGIAIHEQPDFGDNKVVVADMSSTILSRPIDVERYGIIYAGAQKNIGPSGITIIIIREDLIGHARKETPSIFDYNVLLKNDSMFNTPATFPWYVSASVFKWLKSQGGLAEIANRNQQKKQLLYNTIDSSDFYSNQIALQSRSWMNVPFLLADPKLDEVFLKESVMEGLQALKGHRISGGMRASIYNAMPLSGVQALVDFMLDFERRYG